MSGYYPYLLCGLPELNFNMNPDSFSYQDLYNQIFELLSPADQRLAELVLAFPRNEEVAKTYLPMQAEEEAREEFLTDCPWPAYQKELYRHNLAYWLEGDEEAGLSKRPEEETLLILKQKLDEAFYNCMSRYRNKFVRLWYDFDLTLKNTLVAFAARKQKRPADKEFVLPKARIAQSLGSQTGRRVLRGSRAGIDYLDQGKHGAGRFRLEAEAVVCRGTFRRLGLGRCLCARTQSGPVPLEHAG